MKKSKMMTHYVILVLFIGLMSCKREVANDNLNVNPTATPSIFQPTNQLPTGISSDPLPSVKQTGSIKLYSSIEAPNKLESFLNLDSENVSKVDGYDIQFVVSRGGGGMYFYFLIPMEGVKIGSIGESEPGIEGCQEAVTDLQPFSLDNIYSGLYLCAITNQNHLTQLKVNETNLEEGWIEISFITWDWKLID